MPPNRQKETDRNPISQSVSLCGLVDGLLDALVNLLHLGVRVHVAVAVLLGVQHLVFPVDQYDLEVSRGLLGLFAHHLDLAAEALLQVRLDLDKLGSVASSAAVKHYVF